MPQEALDAWPHEDQGLEILAVLRNFANRACKASNWRAHATSSTGIFTISPDVDCRCRLATCSGSEASSRAVVRAQRRGQRRRRLWHSDRKSKSMPLGTKAAHPRLADERNKRGRAPAAHLRLVRGSGSGGGRPSARGFKLFEVLAQRPRRTSTRVFGEAVDLEKNRDANSSDLHDPASDLRSGAIEAIGSTRPLVQRQNHGRQQGRSCAAESALDQCPIRPTNQHHSLP